MTAGVSPGELVVGTFEHPERGMVACAAAPLVAADLRRRGWRVVEQFMPQVQDSDSPSGMMFAVTYLDENGYPFGFAVAAHVTDLQGLSAAEEVVTEWASVLRTRRVLLSSTNPECAGTRRARQLAGLGDGRESVMYAVGGRAGDSRRYAASDGPDVHLVDTVVQVPAKGVSFFPAQGVSAPVRAASESRLGGVVDGTCPLVVGMEHDVRRFVARGDFVVVIGGRRHAVMPTLTSQAPGRVVVVESDDDVRSLRLDPDRVSFVIGGGAVAEEAAVLLAALRRKYPRLRGQHPNGICYAASDEAAAVRSVAAAADVVLVLGGDDERGTSLVGLVIAHGAVAHHLTALSDLRWEWLAGIATVGVVTASPAEDRLRSEVVDAISGLGPVSVLDRGVTTHVVTK